MGTSGSNRGSRRGLVPTWVSDPAPAAPRPAPPQAPASGSSSPGGPSNPQTPSGPPTPIPPATKLPPLPSGSAGASLGSARGDFTRAAKANGGSSGHLKRGTGKYVRAVGGAGNAARIMTPSRGVASEIGRVAADALQRGPAEALRRFNLESMAGAPAAEVFETLADIICPAGGTIDEAIAREAMLAAAADLAASGVTFDALSAEALEAIFLGTIARSIEDKLLNELGSKVVRLPDDAAAVQRIERELHDFVTGAVRDAFAGANGGIAALDTATVDATVADIYERTFEVLQVLGDNA